MLRKCICTALVTLATVCLVWLGPVPTGVARAEMVDSQTAQADPGSVRLARNRELVRINLEKIGLSGVETTRTLERLKPEEIQALAAMPDQLRTAGMYEGAVVVGIALLVLLVLYIISHEEDPMNKDMQTPLEREAQRSSTQRVK